MFVLIAMLYVNGLAENPKIVTHDFKTLSACNAAGQVLEEQSEINGMTRVVWKCTPK